MQSWRNTLNYYRWLQAFWSCLLFSVYNARHDILRTMRKNCILWQDLCKFTFKKKEVHFNKFWKKNCHTAKCPEIQSPVVPKAGSALHPALNLTWVSFFLFKSIFSDNFLRYSWSIESPTCWQKELNWIYFTKSCDSLKNSFFDWKLYHWRLTKGTASSRASMYRPF